MRDLLRIPLAQLESLVGSWVKTPQGLGTISEASQDKIVVVSYHGDSSYPVVSDDFGKVMLLSEWDL